MSNKVFTIDVAFKITEPNGWYCLKSHRDVILNESDIFSHISDNVTIYILLESNRYYADISINTTSGNFIDVSSIVFRLYSTNDSQTWHPISRIVCSPKHLTFKTSTYFFISNINLTQLFDCSDDYLMLIKHLYFTLDHIDVSDISDIVGNLTKITYGKRGIFDQYEIDSLKNDQNIIRVGTITKGNNNKNHKLSTQLEITTNKSFGFAPRSSLSENMTLRRTENFLDVEKILPITALALIIVSIIVISYKSKKANSSTNL
ncbi:hypothetical protein RF11_10364 [Thelohanellus kitauei]|uniref:Uncharacterized protein n=1 Tax=Thelohanellus kitauei TaxID=669202 RepID=A0A0C2NAQ7_THEKT|nr:hypothetical protein RF11_10364 [Thelohanellus kitauei]